MLSYELHDFGGEAIEAIITTVEVRNENAARGRAGRLAKKNGGPVDLIKSGPRYRYVTTAIPNEFHKTGYQFEAIML